MRNELEQRALKESKEAVGKIVIIIKARNGHRKIVTPYLLATQKGIWEIQKVFFFGKEVQGIYRLELRNAVEGVRWQKVYTTIQEAVFVADKLNLKETEVVSIQNLVNYKYVYIRRKN